MIRNILIIFLSFIILPVFGYEGDSIIAENVYFHEINKYKISPTRRIDHQNTYNLSGQLIHSLKYGKSTSGIEQLTFYFYKDKNLISKEIKNINNEMISIKRYTYTSDGKKESEKLYERVRDNLELITSSEYIYKNKQLIKNIVSNSKGTWIEQHKYLYKDQEIIQNSKFKANDNQSNLQSQEIRSILENDQLIKKSIHSTLNDGSENTQIIEYEYDTISGKIKLEKQFDSTQNLVKQIQYRYRSDGTLRNKSVLDADNNYLEHISTNLRYHTIVLGKQEMYDLKNK